MALWLNRVRTVSAALSPSLAASGLLESNLEIRSARVVGSSLGTTYPLAPSSMASEFPPTSVATQGSLAAIASIRELEKPSLREGRQKTSLAARSSGTLSDEP